MHGGVEPVPTELVLQAIRAKPCAVLPEHRPHRVPRPLGDLDADARAEELGVVGREPEFAQDLGQRALERGLVGEARAHRGVQLGRGARLPDVLEVDVVRLERTADATAQERCERPAHRVIEEVDEQALDFGLRDLPREVELACDGGGRLGVVRVEPTRDLGMGQDVAVALGADGR